MGRHPPGWPGPNKGPNTTPHIPRGKAGPRKRAPGTQRVVPSITGAKLAQDNENPVMHILSLGWAILLSPGVVVVNDVANAGLDNVVKPTRRKNNVATGMRYAFQFVVSVMILLFMGQSVALKLIPSSGVNNAAMSAMQGNFYMSLATITAIKPEGDVLTSFMNNFVKKLALCAIVPVIFFGFGMFAVVFYGPRGMLMFVIVMGCAFNVSMKNDIALGDHLGNKVLLPKNRKHTDQCVELRKEMGWQNMDATLDELLWSDEGRTAREASQKAYKQAMESDITGKHDGCKKNRPILSIVAWKSQSQATANMQVFDHDDDTASCGKENVMAVYFALSQRSLKAKPVENDYPQFKHSDLDLNLDADTLKCLAKGQIAVQCGFEENHDCKIANNAIANNVNLNQSSSALSVLGNSIETSADFNIPDTTETAENILDDNLGFEKRKLLWKKIYFQPMFYDSSGQLVTADKIKNSGVHCAWHFCVDDIKRLREAEDTNGKQFMTSGLFTNWHSSREVDKGVVPKKPKITSPVDSLNCKFGITISLVACCLLFAFYKCKHCFSSDHSKHHFGSVEDDRTRLVFFLLIISALGLRLVA